MQMDQFIHFQGVAIDGVGPVLEQPRQEVVDIEDRAIGSANRCLEWLQRNGAEIEREAFEGCGAIGGGFGDPRASAG